jgi:predicted RNA methylase
MSKVTHVYISDLHFEHVQWRNELIFWEEQITSYIKRLEEVVTRWTDNEIRAQVEHFQNQFILHNDVIDVLKKDIKKHEQHIAEYAQEHPVAIQHIHFDDHTGLRDRMDTQRNIYTELKGKYYSFLSKAM